MNESHLYLSVVLLMEGIQIIGNLQHVPFPWRAKDFHLTTGYV